MTVVFRVDASLTMGTGHVMRCLTIANALYECGIKSLFLCRSHAGNLISFIESQGHEVINLGESASTNVSLKNDLEHSSWLGTRQEEDAKSVVSALAEIDVEWIVVDHYALDQRWERIIRPWVGRILAIDDLADRVHDCDILLDQTLGRVANEYRSLVPIACDIFAGAEYSLLRPEFSERRDYSLRRRQTSGSMNILVSMGGVDKDNMTSFVLSALNNIRLPAGGKIIVILGETAPWKDNVQKQIDGMQHEASLMVSVNNVAALMAEADLAIGAAGTTSWERCCLGLPTIMYVLAANQRNVALQLANKGAVKLVHEYDKRNLELCQEHIRKIIGDRVLLQKMAKKAASVTDGLGVNRVLQAMQLAE